LFLRGLAHLNGLRTNAGMVCTVCSSYQTEGPWVTGSDNFKKAALITYEQSSGHAQNVIKSMAKQKPIESIAAKT
jgi:NMD protein affecting ribosome stability and mRNA decay